MNDGPSTFALLGLVVFGLLILQASGAIGIPVIQRLARKVPPRVRQAFLFEDLAKDRHDFADSKSPAADRLSRVLGGAAGLTLIGGAIVGIVT